VVNVGVVIYTRGETSGTLIAKWSHAINGSGTGISKGGPPEGFAGGYHTIYYDENGNEKLTCELLIETNGGAYDLSWIRDGEVLINGIGMDVTDGLIAGYRFKE